MWLMEIVSALVLAGGRECAYTLHMVLPCRGSHIQSSNVHHGRAKHQKRWKIGKTLNLN